MVRSAGARAQRARRRVPRRWRRRIWNVARALIGLGAVAYVISLVHLEDLRQATRTDRLPWALLALACLAANVVVAAWRWQLLLAALGVRERLGPLVRAIYVGAFYNLFLPGQLGGQAIKVMVLARRSPALPQVVASVAMDQIVIINALLGLGFLSALLSTAVAHRGGWMVGFGIATLAAFGLLVVSISPPVERWLAPRARRSRWLAWLPEGLRVQTARTVRQLAVYGRRPGYLAVAELQAVLFMGTMGGMALGLARVVGIDLDPVTVCFVLFLALVAGVAPFTLAGLGTREATFTVAFAQLGVPRGTGAAFAVLWLFLNSLADAMGFFMQYWRPAQLGTAPRSPGRAPRGSA